MPEQPTNGVDVRGIATEIVTRLVENTISRQWIRNINDADAEGVLKEEHLLGDALALALGEDIGCLDERDDDFREAIDLFWLEDKLGEVFSHAERDLAIAKRALVIFCGPEGTPAYTEAWATAEAKLIFQGVIQKEAKG